MRSRTITTVLPWAVMLIASMTSAAPHLVGTWALPPTPSGRPPLPVGIAVGADQSVYVVDIESDRVFRYSSIGDLITSWVVPGSSRPWGVDVDSDGRVYVTKWYPNPGILIYSSDGQLLSEIVPGGSGGLQDPMGIDVTSDGEMYVVHGQYEGVKRYSSNGAFLRSYLGPMVSPFDVVVDPSGNVYVTDGWAGNPRVFKFGPTGTWTAWGGSGTEPGRFQIPAAICRTEDGRLLVLDSGNSRVQEFSADGALLTMWPTEPLAAVNGPVSEMALSRFGDVYITDGYANKILHYAGLPTPTSRSSWGQLKARFR